MDYKELKNLSLVADIPQASNDIEKLFELVRNVDEEDIIKYKFEKKLPSNVTVFTFTEDKDQAVGYSRVELENGLYHILTVIQDGNIRSYNIPDKMYDEFEEIKKICTDAIHYQIDNGSEEQMNLYLENYV